MTTTKQRLVRAAEADQQAHRLTATTPFGEQARWLLDTIGPRFTAASLGIKDARTVRGWRDGKTEPRDLNERGRLALLYRISWTITAVYGDGSVAAGFLRTSNPQLKDEAPLVLLAKNNPDDVQQTLINAVRTFLAEG
jgi:DNA segregation ATPase FtsK/SpoIIIE-like protein